jgi:uncharacterized glyoxalase superfamily protein PhnB
MKPRLEHIAFNVNDPAVAARWCCHHLGMTIVRSLPPPANSHMVLDSAGRVKLELHNDPTAPIADYASLDHNSMHLAFMVDCMTAIRDSLLAAGATLVDDVSTTPTGDKVLMMRSPWGLAMQFVERVTPMLEPGRFRLEHFELNIPDPPGMVKWYVQNLEMNVMRQGGPPVYGSFVADAGGNMMMELQRNDAHPVLDSSTLQHLSVHVAFLVGNVRATRDSLIEAGASLVEQMRETGGGDQILVLRDPWGLPIQIIRRSAPLLK